MIRASRPAEAPPATIEHHATDSSAGYAQYIAAIRATQEVEPTP